ncbi:6-bladed beta-propeller [Gemmatimonadota bacterium]
MKVAELETGNEEALIGSLEYDAASIGPGGNVYVATDSWAGVHEFDSTGKWVQNIGGEGHGPGEYQQVRFISTSRANQLIIYDDIGRVNILEQSGVFSHSFRYMINAAPETRIASAGENRFWTLNWPLTMQIVQKGEDLILLTSEGDTLQVYRFPDSEPEMAVESEGRNVNKPNPAVGALKWTLSPDGDAWVLTPGGEFLVRIPSEGGEPDSLSVRSFPMSFTDEQWAQIREAETAVLREVSFLNSWVEPTEDALDELRDTWSPVQRMWWVDGSGILVDRMTPSYPSIQHGSWRYTALLPDGRMTMDVEGPSGLLTAAFGYALTVSSEWLELPKLTLWRLEQIGR